MSKSGASKFRECLMGSSMASSAFVMSIEDESRQVTGTASSRDAVTRKRGSVLLEQL